MCGYFSFTAKRKSGLIIDEQHALLCIFHRYSLAGH